jgi:hypothetical protein
MKESFCHPDDACVCYLPLSIQVGEPKNPRIANAGGRFGLEALIREALDSGDFQNARIYGSKLEGRPEYTWDDELSSCT